MRALVLQHAPDEGPGLLAQWLPAAGLDLEVVPAWGNDPLPELGPYAAVVLLGGPQAAYDGLDASKAAVRDAARRGLPLLGICLGAQLIAEALGGVVEPGEQGPELGARLVGKRDVAGADPLVWDTPMSWVVVQWHWDAITELPPGATLLATSPKYTQMFRVGKAWGLQFHVECDEAMVRAWVADEDLPEALADRTVAELPEVAELWQPVVARFAAVARGQDPRPKALPLV